MWGGSWYMKQGGVFIASYTQFPWIQGQDKDRPDNPIVIETITANIDTKKTEGPESLPEQN